MKQFLILLIVLLFQTIVSFGKQVKMIRNGSNTLVNQECVVLSSEIKSEGERVSKTFNVDVKQKGNYYVYFWLMPMKNKATNQFMPYDVWVDGNKVGNIVPLESDWQSISLFGEKKMFMDVGKHTVTVIGDAPFSPNIEFVNLSQIKEKAIISNSSYNKYKEKIRKSKAMTKDIAMFSTNHDLNNLPEQNNPPYDYTFRLGMSCRYTTFFDAVCNEGKQLFLEASGIDGTEVIIEVFSYSDPQKYSWTSEYETDYARLNVTIPKTDMYGIRLRTADFGTSGFCTFSFNDVYSYEVVPISCDGIPYNADLERPICYYNTFTCNSTGDPMIGLADANNKIVAWSDDYIGEGDFDWEKDARVKYVDIETEKILLSSWSSYEPISTFDLYIECPYGPFCEEVLREGWFPDLKKDDLIGSAFFTGDYNCISWAGGIYTGWFWPPYVFGEHAYDTLDAFDIFFDMERYPNSVRYTRDGATAENSVIDLWGIRTPDSIAYTHASIRNHSDYNAHGYAWESKDGAGIRFFHPRNALALVGKGYGEVVAHYRKRETANVFLTLDEAIAEDSAVIEHLSFTDEEALMVSNEINGIDNEKMVMFEEKYNIWKSVWKHSHYSNPDLIADCQEYRDLLQYCNTQSELEYAVFEKLASGDVCAVPLIKDISIIGNEENLNKVYLYNKDHVKTSNGATILRPLTTNAMAFVKNILSTRNGNVKNKQNVRTGITYSNSDDFSVTVHGMNLNIEFTSQKKSNISISLISMDGRIVSDIVNNECLDKGQHEYRCSVNKHGFYMLRYVVDGRVNVKKVSVKF